MKSGAFIPVQLIKAVPGIRIPGYTTETVITQFQLPVNNFRILFYIN